MIYLDNAATTQVDPKVMKVVQEYSEEKFGNASSLHTLGLEARRAIENARDVIAKSIGAKSEEIIFTRNFSYEEINYERFDPSTGSAAATPPILVNPCGTSGLEPITSADWS